VEQVRSLPLHPPELDAACLAAPAATYEHKYSLAVDLAILVRLDPLLLPGAQEVAPRIRHPGDSRAAPEGGRRYDVLVGRDFGPPPTEEAPCRRAKAVGGAASWSSSRLMEETRSLQAADLGR
jgi:hypothetical protein